MKKLMFLLLILCVSTGIAQENELFKNGNEAYASGDYQEAIQQYTQVLEQGLTSAALHYNLANAHYKLNHIAPSIYHYEKALQLDPGDEDILNNLQFARNMAIDAIEEEQPTGFEAMISSATGIFSPTGWAWTAIVLMLIFILFFLAYYFSRRTVAKRIFFILGIFLLLMSLMATLIGGLRLNKIQENDFAIIFSEEVEVMAEPSTTSSEIFQLHEGTKVLITENFQDWVEIELPNGNQGWLLKNHVRNL